MPRTPEQRAADEQVTAAIDACRRAYFPHGANELLTDYVVAYVTATYDENGDSAGGIGVIVRDNDLPPHRVRGLLSLTIEEDLS